MDPFRSLVGFCPRNGGMADGKNGRMVEWWEWLHTYYLRYTHTNNNTDDTLIFYSIDNLSRYHVRDPSDCKVHIGPKADSWGSYPLPRMIPHEVTGPRHLF